MGVKTIDYGWYKGSRKNSLKRRKIMRYKHFKNTDADISALTVGRGGLQGKLCRSDMGDVDTEESIAAIRQMIDNGLIW